MDSTIGGAVVVFFIFFAPLETALAVLIVGPVIALCVKKLLFLLKLKKSSR